MKETKVDLFNSFNQLIFDIDEGYITQNLNSVILSSDNNHNYNAKQVYRLQGSSYVLIDNLIDFMKKFDWKEKFYIRNNNYGYYGYGSSRQQQQYEEFAVSSISINLSCNVSLSFSNRGNHIVRKDKSIKINSPKDLEKIYEKKYSIITDEKKINYYSPSFYEIKVGDNYWVDGVGKVTITQKYEFPNKDNKLFQIIRPDGSLRDGTSSDVTSLMFLPFDSIPKSKTSIFNDCLNEIQLMPFLVFNEKTYNLYWKKIEDASSYVVSIYRKMTNFGSIEYYHIADYEIDRNNAYFSIDGLIGRNADFIFKLYAENRHGERIAESRGIVNGQPQFFEEVR